MPLVHWLITNMNGELDGLNTQLNVTSLQGFNSYEPPDGYMKVLLAHEEYLKIDNSFNKTRKIYEKGADPIESKAVELSEERKTANEIKAKPNKYRYRHVEGGMILHEYYDLEGKLIDTKVTGDEI